MNINLLPKELRQPEPKVAVVQPNIRYSDPTQRSVRMDGSVIGRVPWYRRLFSFISSGKLTNNSTAHPTVGISPVPAPITPAAPLPSKPPVTSPLAEAPRINKE